MQRYSTFLTTVGGGGGRRRGVITVFIFLSWAQKESIAIVQQSGLAEAGTPAAVGEIRTGSAFSENQP